MDNSKSIHYIKNLKQEDFVDFAEWWANKYFVEVVNNPKLYNEFKRYSLVFHYSLTGFEDEDIRMLVFEDYFCANDRGRGPEISEFTAFWIPYVYSRLPENSRENYAKSAGEINKTYAAPDYLKKLSERLQFPTRVKIEKDTLENEHEKE